MLDFLDFFYSLFVSCLDFFYQSSIGKLAMVLSIVNFCVWLLIPASVGLNNK